MDSVESFLDLVSDIESEPETVASVTKPTKAIEKVKKEKSLIYSQRLGQFVPCGVCMRCGLEGHVAKSPTCSLIGDRSWHFSGQTTPQQRATRFVDWILTKFELGPLQGGGVLDIAGGQGKLAMEFQFRRKVPCTVVDPREIVLSQKQQKFISNQPDAGSPPKQKLILFLDDFLEDPDNLAVFEKVQLLVGLHPDEATERIVQFGLKYKKNFAVVPCCVFGRMFPHRKKPDGTPVKYYEDFCDYLQTLDPGIQRDLLPIPGRNVVLWKKF